MRKENGGDRGWRVRLCPVYSLLFFLGFVPMPNIRIGSRSYQSCKSRIDRAVSLKEFRRRRFLLAWSQVYITPLPEGSNFSFLFFFILGIEAKSRGSWPKGISLLCGQAGSGRSRIITWLRTVARANATAIYFGGNYPYSYNTLYR